MKSVTIYLLISIFGLLIAGCQSSSSDEYHQEKDRNQFNFTSAQIDSIYYAGENLYTLECESCHGKLYRRHQYVRWSSMMGKTDLEKLNFFSAYMSNTDSLARVDPYVKELKEEYNNSTSHHFKFTRNELVALATYIRGERYLPQTAK